MTDRGLRRIAIAILAITIPLFVLVIVLTTRNRVDDGIAFISVALAMIVGYVGVGTLIAARRPRSAVGWLMVTIGLGFLLAGLSDEYVTYAYRTNPGGLPFRTWFAWLGNWVFVPAFAPVMLLIALFPTGRVHSPRWRWFPRTVLALAAGVIVTSILTPGNVDTTVGGIPNPTGVPAFARTSDVLLLTLGVGLIVCAGVSVIALVLRFRASSGDERQQLRWFAFVARVAGVLFLLAFVSGAGVNEGRSNPINDFSFYALLGVIGVGMPAAIGVSLLRYRLYDLDLVIKKTLVFGIVVVLLTAAFVFLVVFVGALVGRVGLLESTESGYVYVFLLGALIVPLWRLSKRIADRVVFGGRATPYEVLTEFSERMTEAYATDDVLPRMARVVAEAVGAERAEIWLRVGEALKPVDGWPSKPSDEPVRVRDDSLPPLGTGDAFEVRHQGDLLGAISVTLPANDPMNPTKARLVRDLAGQAGLVLRNVRLIEELRASRQRLVAAQDQERRKLERNIHDGAQQQLVALAVKLRLADRLVDRDPARAHELMTQLQAETGEALEDLRDLARGIYPPLLAEKGLAAALEAQARKAAIPVDVLADGMERHQQDVESVVYFSCLEALSNTAKYADATRAVVRLEQTNGLLRFSVSDDGVGFDPTASTRGTGLQGIADRLEAIGGSMQIVSAPAAGATVSGTVPLEGRAP